jgi:accessory gene regulator protein AgrB
VGVRVHECNNTVTCYIVLVSFWVQGSVPLVYAFVNINLYFGLPSQIIIKLHIVKQMLVTRRPIDLYHSH